MLALSCGDNVGRLFDRGYGKGGGTASSSIQAPAPKAVVLANRPLVQRVAPTGGGAQATTAVYVLFNEAMNLESLKASTTQEPAHLYLRRKGSSGGSAGGSNGIPGGTTTNTPLPGTYDLLLGGRLLVFRPSPALAPNQTYEIFAGNNVRDLDRSTLQKQGVLGEFKTDGNVQSGPSVVFEYPALNDQGTPRDAPVLIGFSQPIDPTTVKSSTFFMSLSTDKSAVPGTIDYPLMVGPAPDTRLARFVPTDPLGAVAGYDFTYTDGIQTGTIKLAVGTRKPPIQFTTMAPLAPISIRVGNPTTDAGVTFENKINLRNLDNLTLEVDLPAGTLVGDKVLLRIYGQDASVTTADSLLFTELTTQVTIAGAHQEVFPVPGKVGTVAKKLFKDGKLSFAAAVLRGTSQTGLTLALNPEQDTVRPTVDSLGPPLAIGTTNVFLTDLNAAAIHGTASEALGALELTVASQTYGLFASTEDGRFFSLPFFLGRNSADLPFAMNAIDGAGNRSLNSFNGFFRQRGFLTGSVAGGSLRVLAYDDATLQPISGVQVIIEPGFPQKPAVGQISAQTLADGSVTFTGLASARYSITLVRAGYHLYSLLNTGAAQLSLPMRPLAQATATVSGTLAFGVIPGMSAKAGLNLLDDDSNDGGVNTNSTNANTLDAVAVRPNRPLMATGFAGILPPTGKPAFLFTSAELASTNGGKGVNLPPQSVKGGGQAYTVAMAMAAPAVTGKYLVPYTVDLSKALGLDTTKLDGDLQVHLLASLGGFSGTSLMGLGFTTGTGSIRSVDGNYDTGTLLSFAGLGPLLWSSVQAKDQAGNISRSRAVFTDTSFGLVLVLGDMPGVPVLDAPAGNFTGSPAVTFADRMDTASLANSVAPRRIRAVDSKDRRWDLYSFDEDGTSASAKDTIQFPVLPSGTVGLSTGAWKITVEDWFVLAPGSNASEINFEDFSRLHLGWARSKAENHTIQ